MLSFRTRAAGAATVAALAAIFAFFLPVGAANASATTCHPITSLSECTSVAGSGLKITSISGHLYNSTLEVSYSNVHIEIYGPNGLIKNCGQYNQGFGNGPTCSWTNPHPTANMTPGDYCSEAWQYTYGSGYAPLSTECIGVHS
jgi:hypothetical protein